MQVLLTALAAAAFGLVYLGPAESGARLRYFATASVSRKAASAPAVGNHSFEECDKGQLLLKEDKSEKEVSEKESEKDSEKEAEEKLSEEVQHFFIGEEAQEAEEAEYNSVKEACYRNWQLVATTFAKSLQANRSAEITAELQKYFEENPQPRKRVATRKGVQPWNPTFPKAGPPQVRDKAQAMALLAADATPQAKAAAFKKYLEAIDDDPPLEDVLESVMRLLSDSGITCPKHLVGATEDEVANLWTGTIHVKAYLRRVVRAANLEGPTSPPKMQQSGGQHNSLALSPAELARDELEEAYGTSGSAQAVALALRTTGDIVRPGVPDLLRQAEVKLEGLPHWGQADVTLWHSLWLDTQVAQKNGRKAWTYVEFTSKLLLPPWMPASALGGSAANSLDPNASTAELAALSNALRGAMASPKFFRSMMQWSSIFWRYAPVAISAGQWTLVQAINYHGLICQLAEEIRCSGGTPAQPRENPLLALSYDASARESWAQRCSKMDPDFDMDEETARINERVLAAARTKWAMSKQGKASDPAESARRDAGAGNQALAQSATAAELLQKRAAQAARSLQQEADQARRRTQAAQHDQSRRDREAPSDYQQGGGGRQPRKSRRSDWFNKDQNHKTWNRGGGSKKGGKGQG